jgi:predicted signal transduction protein with EAL and GGDEF domain
MVGRLGGDEFVIIMPGLSDAAAAESVAERLLDDLSQPIPDLEGPDLRVTASIGISIYPRDGATSEALLNTADTAMYRVKESGRNAWQSYQASLVGTPADASQLAGRITDALERGEIVAHYQPIVDFATGRVAAVEA